MRSPALATVLALVATLIPTASASGAIDFTTGLVSNTFPAGSGTERE